MRADVPIHVEIDRETLITVINSLHYLHEAFGMSGAIDRAQLMATRAEVAGMVAQLEAGLSQGDPVTLILVTARLAPPAWLARAELRDVHSDVVSDVPWRRDHEGRDPWRGASSALERR